MGRCRHLRMAHPSRQNARRPLLLGSKSPSCRAERMCRRDVCLPAAEVRADDPPGPAYRQHERRRLANERRGRLLLPIERDLADGRSSDAVALPLHELESFASRCGQTPDTAFPVRGRASSPAVDSSVAAGDLPTTDDVHAEHSSSLGPAAAPETVQSVSATQMAASNVRGIATTQSSFDRRRTLCQPTRLWRRATASCPGRHGGRVIPSGRCPDALYTMRLSA